MGSLAKLPKLPGSEYDVSDLRPGTRPAIGGAAQRGDRLSVSHLGASIPRSVDSWITPLANRAKLDRSFFPFDRITPAERRYLRAMAELGPGPHRSGEIAGVYGASVTRLADVRDSLIDKGMVYSPVYGQTEFTVPLFDDSLTRGSSTSRRTSAATRRRTATSTRR
jgi:hypothetical protein